MVFLHWVTILRTFMILNHSHINERNPIWWCIIIILINATFYPFKIRETKHTSLFLFSVLMIWCASVRKPHLYKPVYNDSLEPQSWNLWKGSFRTVMLTFRETCDTLTVVTSVSPGGSKLKETRDGHSRQGDCSSRPVPRPWRVRLQTGPTCPKGLGLLGGPLGVLGGRAVTELSAVSGRGPPDAGVDHGAELSLLQCQHLGPAIRGASGASRLSLGCLRPSSGILPNSQRPLGSPLPGAVQAAGCRR